MAVVIKYVHIADTVLCSCKITTDLQCDALAPAGSWCHGYIGWQETLIIIQHSTALVKLIKIKIIMKYQNIYIYHNTSSSQPCSSEAIPSERVDEVKQSVG